MKEWIELVAAFGLGGVFFGYAVFWSYQHPEIVKQWLALFYSLLSRVWSKYKYKSTKYRLESRLNKLANDLSDYDDIEQTKVKIEWAAIDGEMIDHKLEENEVVVVMRDRGSENKNLVYAAYYYVSTMLLWRAKKHISKKQRQALDIYTSKKLISEQNHAAYRLFMEEFFQPLVDDEKVKGMVEKFIEIDESGFYTHILLKELGYLGAKSMMVGKDRKITEEVSNLINFLHTFSKRTVGDDTAPDEFLGSYSKCAIKIVSTFMVRSADKTSGPANRIGRAFSHGVENVYVVGPTEDNGINFVNKVCDEVIEARPNCSVLCKRTFKGRINKGGKKYNVLTYFAHIQDMSNIEYTVRQEEIDAIDQLRRLEENVL